MLDRNKGKVAVCLIVKDENEYLKEWCDHHLALGFDAIILADNESAVHPRDTLGAYSNRIIYLDRPGEHPAIQHATYGEVCQKYHYLFEWILFIDADEFLCLDRGNIKDYINRRQYADVLVFNWKVFGAPTGNTGLVKEDCVMRIDPDNFRLCQMFKSMVRPDLVTEFKGAHYPRLSRPFYKPDGSIHQNNRDLVVYSGACIHHYYARSVVDIDEKVLNTKKSTSVRNTHSVGDVCACSHIEDRNLVGYVVREHVQAPGCTPAEREESSIRPIMRARMSNKKSG